MESIANKKSISQLDPISDNNVSLSAKSPVQQPNQIPFEQVSLNQIKRTIIAECSTAAATANKTATVTNFAGFALIPGIEILVHFTNANTANNITLSINGTNAYPIKALGTTEQLGNGSIKAGTYKKLIFTGDTYLTEAPTISAVDSGSDLPLNSVAITDALKAKLGTNLKGAAGGLAELDSAGRVPSSQLPSYVDDVLEYDSKSAFPTNGESEKIYISRDTNITYRWSGTAYVEIAASLAIGETSSTAFAGDKGKIAYNHATDPSKITVAKSIGLFKFSVSAEGHISGVTAVTKDDLTALGIPASDTNTTYTLGIDGDSVKLTPSSGTAQKITVPYATKAGSATSSTKATQDGNGNAIASTYATKATAVTGIAYDSTNKKITKTINGITTDVVSVATLKSAMDIPSGLTVDTALSATSTNPVQNKAVNSALSGKAGLGTTNTFSKRQSFDGGVSFGDGDVEFDNGFIVNGDIDMDGHDILNPGNLPSRITWNASTATLTFTGVPNV